MRHFSWSYLLTIAHLLLFKNSRNIEDDDQKAIMSEVIGYFEHSKSGVIGVTQMSKGWVEICKKTVAGINLQTTDEDLKDAVLSWQQEERNLALNISRELGTLEEAIQELKGKEVEVREFKIILFKNLVSSFASPKKFVESIEKLVGNYYSIIVQNLTKWEPLAPKVKESNIETSLDEERFIDAINHSPMINVNDYGSS